MKDYKQVDGMNDTINGCLRCAYDRGYRQGYSDGIKDGNINDETFSLKVKEAYENGLNDAWECARLIALDEDEGGLAVKDVREIFGMNHHHAFSGYSASEAIAKIREYREKQNQTEGIKVGDEIIYGVSADFTKATVLDIDTDGALWIIDENVVVSILDKSVPRHITGKHYGTLISEIIQKMRESGDEPRCEHCKHLGDCSGICQNCMNYSGYEYIYRIPCTEGDRNK